MTAVVLCAAVLTAGLAGYVLVRHRQQDLLALTRPSWITASVSTPLADLMGLLEAR